MLELSHIDKTFHPGTVNAVTVFSDFSLTVPRGSFVSIVGSNGSGKSTLLSLISGALRQDRGSITLGGMCLDRLPEHRRARRIGRVFQDPARGTVPGMTVRENLLLAATKGGRYDLTPARRDWSAERFLPLLRGTGLALEDKLNTPVAALSGGQRQALALLMCTENPADLLLFDEHTAALDPRTAEIMMHLTDRIVRETGVTALMVTHNLRYAAEYGDRLLMLHEGRVVLSVEGAAKATLRVEDLLDRFNAISVECGN